VNPAFEQALGYSLPEMLQKNVWDICHPDYKDLIRYRARAACAVKKYRPIMKSGPFAKTQ
jgi:PAS domain S-box-containing protein